jgi:sugar lactone lactonase YvrE
VIHVEMLITTEMVMTFAGTVMGDADGYGTNAQFSSPYGICWDLHGDNMYICDSGNNAIRKLSLHGTY